MLVSILDVPVSILDVHVGIGAYRYKRCACKDSRRASKYMKVHDNDFPLTRSSDLLASMLPFNHLPVLFNIGLKRWREK